MAMIHIAIFPDNRNACENKASEIASKLGNGWHVWMNKRLTFQINGSKVQKSTNFRTPSKSILKLVDELEPSSFI